MPVGCLILFYVEKVYVESEGETNAFGVKEDKVLLWICVDCLLARVIILF